MTIWLVSLCGTYSRTTVVHYIYIFIYSHVIIWLHHTTHVFTLFWHCGGVANTVLSQVGNAHPSLYPHPGVSVAGGPHSARDVAGG